MRWVGLSGCPRALTPWISSPSRQLSFEQPDFERFPCLRLGIEAVRAGGTSSAILNAANEVSVQAFLEGRLRFTHIPQIIQTTLEDVSSNPAESLDRVLDDDRRAREFATGQVARLTVERT